MAKKGSAHEGFKHGRSNHPLYGVWIAKIIINCCDRWKNIENFIEDAYPMYKSKKQQLGKKRICLVRLDESKPFDISNIKWIAFSERLMESRGKIQRKTISE